jgi:hypothetical protein
MELFNSVGIELETEDIRGDDLSRTLNNLNFIIHRDASCESDGYTSNNFKIDVENTDKEILNLLPLNKNTYGCEVVTRGTLDTSNLDYIYKLKKITNSLISHGESPKSYRAGFHVHVNVAYNLQILKSILRLTRHLEQVLYLLGGMGYDYRGIRNNSTYCRPITKFGPVCVKTGWNKFSQVFSISDLLKVKTTSSFKNQYGNIDRLRGNRYIPIRYHGINLLPLFTQGSLEFRMFNKSTNPYFLMAIIEFCKAVSAYAVQSSFKSLKEENLLKENSIFDVKGEQDRGHIIETFSHFLDLSNLESREAIDALYEILHTSSVESLVTKNEYMFTHLMFHRQGSRSAIHWENREYKPTTIEKSKIKVPQFEDIHVLRENEENRNLGRGGRNLIDDLGLVQQLGGRRGRTTEPDWLEIDPERRNRRRNPERENNPERVDPPEFTEYNQEENDEVRQRIPRATFRTNTGRAVFSQGNTTWNFNVETGTVAQQENEEQMPENPEEENVGQMAENPEENEEENIDIPEPEERTIEMYEAGRRPDESYRQYWERRIRTRNRILRRGYRG